MSRIFTCLLCVVLTGQTLWAQQKSKVDNPGYLGANNQIGYRFMAFPALDGNSRDNSQAHAIHSLQFSRTLNKNFNLDLSLEYNASITEEEERNFNFRSLGPGLAIDFFPFRLRGRIAPVGAYTRLQLRYLVIRVDPVPREISQPFYDGNTPNHFLAGSFEIGKNFLLTDFLLFNLAARLSRGTLVELERTPDELDVRQQLARRDIFALKTGLSYLF